MDACLSWSVPAVERPSRIDKGVAGAPLKHDSLNPDYRDPLVHKLPSKKLTTSKWYTETRNGMPEKGTISPPEKSVRAHARPTCTQDNSDIDRSWPKHAFHTYQTDQPRMTNPLQPTYAIAAAPVSVVPIGRDSAVLEGHVFHAMRHPEWSFNRGAQPLGSQNADIPGTRAKSDRKQRPSKDYDLDSITKPRNRGVATRQPRNIDVGRLGMWSRCPDRHMQHSSRHCDPLQPTYYVHDRTLSPIPTKKELASSVGERVSARMQGEIGPDKQSLVNQMVAMSRVAKPRNFFPHKRGVLDLHEPEPS
eukprot:jgi/Ulvmu1/8925/UM005_0016.1